MHFHELVFHVSMLSVSVRLAVNVGFQRHSMEKNMEVACMEAEDLNTVALCDGLHFESLEMCVKQYDKEM